ncbi:transcriptional regulator, LysR family [Loktanella atrilutea]|uniref:Transcriptional regulator, LysR family n=1 Tax=Loktanella atrilutea TaxID=366533 RepID=A0A1M5FNU3_LOKAT|nr:LysR family transcriptional regulator [Loktanella atrilutea]SHF93163.1 transcriptional regulator, LysR family [Loktanella atrilutea]
MDHHLNPAYIRRLQYFESVARHKSLLRAAKELGISSSAVSHQMRDLSRTLGEELFVRSGRGVALTPAGEMLAVQVSSTFEHLAATLRDMIGGTSDVLRVAVCSSFGPHWLAPRLPAFVERCPETRLEIRLYAEHPDQTQDVADCIITAQETKLGFICTPLFEEHLTAVIGATVSGEQRDTLPLITTDCMPGEEMTDWRRFAIGAELDFDVLSHRGFTGCTHYLLAMALAEAGLGIALVPDFVAAAALAAGRLDRHHVPVVSSGRTYKACFKESRAHDRGLRQFANWMQREAVDTLSSLPK